MDRGAWVLQSNKELDTTKHLTLSLFSFKGDWKLYILFFFSVPQMCQLLGALAYEHA